MLDIERGYNSFYAGVRFGARVRLKESQYQIGDQKDRAKLYASLEQVIGLTPLIKFDAPNGSTIWAKVESENPSESHYDRAALATLKTLETADLIKPGDTLIEGTSGSAGRSFAYMCNRLGYNLKILVPSEIPRARLRDMEKFGATLIDVGSGGIKRVIDRHWELLQEYNKSVPRKNRKSFKLPGGKAAYVFEKDGQRVCFSNHGESLLTPQAFNAIGFEALAQLPEGVSLDYFIGILGNGSTIKGISEILKSRFQNLQIIGIEELACPTHYVRKYGEDQFEKVYGRKPIYSTHELYGASVPMQEYKPPFIELDNIDEIRLVSNYQYRTVKRDYNRSYENDWEIPMQIGNTSAACLSNARQLATEKPGSNVFILFYDKADQYSDWRPKSPIHEMTDAVREYQTINVWAKEREKVRKLVQQAA